MDSSRAHSHKVSGELLTPLSVPIEKKKAQDLRSGSGHGAGKQMGHIGAFLSSDVL